MARMSADELLELPFVKEHAGKGALARVVTYM